jgi:very-short-patch-repair endonuclease
MSLNKKSELVALAKAVCRKLRNNSTETEKIFWEAVRNKRFEGKKFYRQHPLFYDLTGTETFFIADFYCYEEKLIIELDGIYHQYRLKQDEERTKILNLLGVRVIRFTNNEIIKDINTVLNKIKILLG